MLQQAYFYLPFRIKSDYLCYSKYGIASNGSGFTDCPGKSLEIPISGYGPISRSIDSSISFTIKTSMVEPLSMNVV